MNHCTISEDETTKFMNPQCHSSLLAANSISNHSALSTSSATVQGINLTSKLIMLAILKIKHVMKHPLLPPDHLTGDQSSCSANNYQMSSVDFNAENQVTCQIGSIVDTKCNQVRRLSNPSKEMQKEKLKGKGESFGCSLSGGLV